MCFKFDTDMDDGPDMHMKKKTTPKRLWPGSE